MFKLLKYELIRRKKALIAFGISLVFIELLILNFVRNQNQLSQMSILLLGLLAIGLVSWVFFDTIISYYSDFKKDQGTLLFLTPIKGQSLILSKIIFAVLQMILASAIFALCVWLADLVAKGVGYTSFVNLISLRTGMDGLEPSLNDMHMQLADLKNHLPVNWLMVEFTALSVLDLLANIMIAFTAITIGRTLLSRNSLNWLYALLIYFAITIALQFVVGAILFPVIMSDVFELESMTWVSMRFDEIYRFIQKMVIIDVVTSLATLCGGFFLSSMLINKKIDI